MLTTPGRSEVVDEIVRLAQELIRIPSRAGVDDVAPILAHVESWCERNGLAPTRLADDAARPVGIALTVDCKNEGRSVALDACLDTAPFGGSASWRHGPTSAVVDQRRLYGRGAADSKTAAAIFLVLIREIARNAPPAGVVHLLLDADEHSGVFGGVKRFVETVVPHPDAMWIGYPGNHTIVAGSRGFLRASIKVSGVGAHTGSKRVKGVNAVSRACRIVEALEGLPLPAESDDHFSFGPKLTVTALHGGEGFSVVPDSCTINVDVRLTPNVNRDTMAPLIVELLREHDKGYTDAPPTEVVWEESWPAFRVARDHPAIRCLHVAAERELGREVQITVSGPSNIGNLLADHGIPAMAGFGVTYDNVHAANEWCEIDSIGPVYRIYAEAIAAFLGEVS